MRRSKKLAVVGKNCVACGSCGKSCPIGVISVYKGLHARVNGEKCAGCGKCALACPAGIIEIVTREAAS
jgi:Fe-S-cluster-containing hydrogenase component 2